MSFAMIDCPRRRHGGSLGRTAWGVARAGLATMLISAWFVSSIRAAEPINVARGRPCTFLPKPDYGLCTDAGDASDLTDGVAVTDAKICFWCQKGCVGWGDVARGVTITIDLGQVVPISGISWNAAAGTSNVTWPTAIEILVSDDGQTFFHAGELLRLSVDPLPPAYGTYGVRRIATRDLRTFGRYVRLHLPARVSYVFVDEIEVFAGDETMRQVDRGSAVTVEALGDPLTLTRQGCYLRVRRDIEIIESAVPARGAAAAGCRETLGHLRAELERSNFPAQVKGFRALVPFHDLHARVWAVRGELLALGGDGPALRVWHTKPYEHLSMFETPRNEMPPLSVALLAGERRAETINITNASTTPRAVLVAVRKMPPEAGLQLQQVGFIDTLNGHSRGLALLPVERVGDQYRVTVPAGMTLQLWLAFEPRSLPPGDHSGEIVLTSDAWARTVPISLAMAPGRIDASDFRLGMWDYIFDESYGIDPSNKDAARRHVLADPMLNVVWATLNSTPMPRAADDAGNLVGDIDFARWDEFVRFWGSTKRYIAFTAFLPDSRFLKFARGTEPFRRAVAEWARRWAAHNRDVLGLQPGQVAVLLVDEPAGEVWHKAALDFSLAFRDGTRDILIFNDPAAQELHTKYGPELVDASDIVCVDPTYFGRATEPIRRTLASLGAEGRELWFYRCFGPVRDFDHSYFRAQPWHAAAYGGVGQGFWAYHPPEGVTSWNEYLSHGIKVFTPLLIDETSVTSTLQYEAIREGIMDWHELRLLTRRVAELDAAGAVSPKLDVARRLVGELPGRLVATLRDEHGEVYYDRWSGQCGRVDEAHRSVHAALRALPPEHPPASEQGPRR